MAVYSFDGAFRNLNNAMTGIGDAYEESRKRQTLADIGTALQSGDYAGAQSLALKAGELNAGLKLAEMAQNRADTAAFNKGFEGLLSGGGSTLGSLGTGSSVQAQPSPTGGASLVNLGNPNQIETRFMSGIREAGLTNPYGLATVAAYGKRESGWSPQNANRSWSDPSQSGQAGTSGGLFAWRNERLRNLYGFAQQRGENIGSITPETQAAFLASEDPTLIPRLNNAKSVAEANRIMADAWRFAGYQGNSPEYNARLQTAMAYLPRYQGDGNTIQRATGQPQPTMVAQAQSGATTPDQARAGIARIDSLLNDRELTPQQRQSLEQRRERYVQVAQQGQPSQQQADIPAQGAMEAQQEFVIPGTGATIPAGTRITPRAANMMRMLSMNVPESRKEAIKILLQEELKASNPATQLDLQNKQLQNQKLQRELEGEGAIPLSGDQKRQFGIPDGQAAWFNRRGELKLGPAGTTVNNTIDNKVETEEGKERAKSAAKFLGGIADAAPQIAQRNADLDMLGRVISRTPTGAGADTRAFLDRIGAGLGLSSGKLATQADAINAIVNRIAPTLRQVGSGAQSDTELRGFLSSLPSLTALPEGNQLILSTLKRAANIERARAGVAARWQSGKLTAGEARDQIAKLDEQSIYANDQERELVAGLFGSLPQTGKEVPNGQGKPSTGWKIIGVE